jgi:hypothetical protein
LAIDTMAIKKARSIPAPGLFCNWRTAGFQQVIPSMTGRPSRLQVRFSNVIGKPLGFALEAPASFKQLF